MRRTIVAAASLLLAIAPAGAAVLSQANGNVLVNVGNGFGAGQAGQQLKPGDRVMIGTGGGDAFIAYSTSCVERVSAGTVVVVKQGIPCTPSSPQAPAQAGFGNFTGVPTDPLLIVGGAALIVGAGVGIYQLTKPSSP
jgi:hypothetical protein